MKNERNTKGDVAEMKTIAEYEEMSALEQESFIAHASADLVQKMYYENNSKGLEVFTKNLTVVMNRAKVCIECLGILKRENDVCSKIYLLLDYMSKRGISKEFVSGLEEITDFAQEILAQADGAMPTEAERREIMKRLRTVLDRNDNQSALEAAMPEEPVETSAPAMLETSEAPAITRRNSPQTEGIRRNVAAKIERVAV